MYNAMVIILLAVLTQELGATYISDAPDSNSQLSHQGTALKLHDRVHLPITRKTARSIETVDRVLKAWNFPRPLKALPFQDAVEMDATLLGKIRADRSPDNPTRPVPNAQWLAATAAALAEEAQASAQTQHR